MKVYELLSDESKWTKGALARNKDGFIIASKRTKSTLARDKPENSTYACSWCLVGAMRKCYPDYAEYKIICNKLNIFAGDAGFMRWNDAPERTYQEVYNLCKELDV